MELFAKGMAMMVPHIFSVFFRRKRICDANKDLVCSLHYCYVYRELQKHFCFGGGNLRFLSPYQHTLFNQEDLEVLTGCSMCVFCPCATTTLATPNRAQA